MSLLSGKNALIFGVANKLSIAWAVTQALHREGANIALSYGLEQLEKRVKPLAEQVDCDFVELCDVSSDEQIDLLFQKYQERYGKLDILIHSVAYSPTEDLQGRFSEMSRNGFHIALDISAYSLIAMARRARPLMTDGGSITAMSYFAAEKVMPSYNAMAVAKAALETCVRYLAADLGPEDIRVNAISAGPIKTLSASAVKGFRMLVNNFADVAPLRRNITQEDVADTCIWLASHWGRSVTGEIVHVDAGYNILGLTAPDNELWGSEGSDELSGS